MKLLVCAAALSVTAAAYAAEPIAFGDPGLGWQAVNQQFSGAIASRYPAGAAFAATAADIAANGFTCEAVPRPANPAAALAAPSHECIRETREAGCNREWAIELREAGGRLTAPAAGSFATMCVGEILPAKRSKAYQN